MFTQQSMSFDGEYIENLIDGYTTISVDGREALDIDLTSETVGIRDGSIYKRKRYQSRTLKVSFVIEGASREDLELKVRQLNGILHDDSLVEIMVDDEPDVLYVGTRAGSSDISITMGGASEGGIASGSFDIQCPDGFKYSRQEYESVASEDPTTGSMVFDIDYGGTAPSYPRFETQFYSKIPPIDDDNMDDESITGLEDDEPDNIGDCSFVAFYNENEKILQFGNPDYVPSKAAPKSQTLINQSFKTVESWGDTAQSKWQLNSGTFNTDPSYWNHRGSLNIAYPKYNTSSVKTSGVILTATSDSTSVAPNVTYKVDYTASSRRTDRCKITAKITSKVAKSDYNIPKGVILEAHILLGGQEHSKKIKTKDELWKAGTTYTDSFDFTLTGLNSETTEISGAKVAVFTSFAGVKGYSKKSAYSKGSIVEYQGKLYRAKKKVPKVEKKDEDKNKGWHSADWENISQMAHMSKKSGKKVVIPTFIEPTYNSYYLAPDSYGTDTVGMGSGPCIIRAIPADKSGTLGAANWTFSWNMKFSIGNTINETQQRGFFQALVLDEHKQLIAGVGINKKAAGSKMKFVKYFYKPSVTGKFFATESTGNLDASYGNKYFGATHKGTKVVKADVTNKGSGASAKITSIATVPYAYKGTFACKVVKKGSTVSFTMGGKTLSSVKIPSNLKAYYIQFGFFKISGYPAVDFSGIYKCKFVNNSCNTTIEYDNPFSSASLLVADTNDAEILLDGNKTPGLGALGNDWEDMKLTPGPNRIGASYELVDPETSGEILRQCYSSEPFGGDYYSIMEGLSESDFNDNKTSFWVVSSTRYIRCTSANPFQDANIYYNSSGVAYDPQPTEEQYNANPGAYYLASVTYRRCTESDVYSATTDYYYRMDGAIIYYNSSGEAHNPQPLLEDYQGNETNYWVKESILPQFKMYYREVFI